jgi:hypothetical protein
MQQQYRATKRFDNLTFFRPVEAGELVMLDSDYLEEYAIADCVELVNDAPEESKPQEPVKKTKK